MGDIKTSQASSTSNIEKRAYCTFPETATHAPRDKSPYHGREDSRRMIAVVRRFPVPGATKSA
ncbi:hypothetical protein [Pelomicrobium methylotrophicum]|uniref:Uncharacterized protein n=1 Tax=Pelomicrobium methylotrophicum TaxID=2602750 RepID=A0A5C7EHW2_9PROT|nr:hypothetical protein [Pelomicrobium methylotrophicum]TXF10911.1 hypothetical protein FR698_13275 [Pelomicrobium methylotrophicum]